MDYEAGRARLEALIRSGAPELKAESNEAETRFHLIDVLLLEVLGWEREDLVVEWHEDGEYADYHAGRPPQLLIEAKRQSHHFTLPAGWNQDTCSLQTLFAGNAELESAVRQALGYSNARGIPLAAVFNGTQVVAFVATRTDGVPPLRGRAIVFSSLAQCLERFRQFWDLLSAAGVKLGTLQALLGADREPPPPEKLSRRIVTYPGYKNRNPIAVDLQILGGLFIEDITRAAELEESFLAETYCQSGALSQYSLVSRELLKARYSTFFEKEAGVSARPAATKHGLAPELTQDILAASLSRRPVLLVGDVGSGKSMFIRHLIKVEAKAELTSAIVLYIDFGSNPAVVDDLRPFVVREIVSQLRTQYGIDIYERHFIHGVYHGRLEQFSRGIAGDLKATNPSEFADREFRFLNDLVADTEQHLRASLEHASKGQRRQIVAFLDNVDQRPAKFQDEVFLIAQAFATNWPMTVFLALRPETFAESRSHGSLSGYQPRVFTISPPRVDLVLQRRLRWALARLEKNGGLDLLPGGGLLHSENLEAYLRLLLQTFESQGPIVEFVDNMCAGNIRRALDFIADFVGSAHVNAPKILEIIDRQGHYNLPLHEFLRAVLRGDHEHYDPADSPLMNVFDISMRDGREHFLVPLVVESVARAGQVGGRDGFVPRMEIEEQMRIVGFADNQVKRAIQRSLGGGLLATPVGMNEDETGRVRVTTAGVYAARRLVELFAYVDAMIVDTPIVDETVRAKILDVWGIEDRAARIRVFVDYLDDCWKRLDAGAHALFEWSAHSTNLRLELAEVERRVHH